MKYLHYQIQAGPEHLVVVTMNEDTDFKFAKVRLLDTGNYFKYRIGKDCASKQLLEGAPRVVLEPPYKGTWHVIIELSIPGELKATVDIMKKGL